jgi:Leucine-rich repeat (LRR) protein
VGESDVPENIRAAIALLPTIVSAAASKSPETAHSEVMDDGLRLKVEKIAKTFPGAITFESQQSDSLIFTAASLRSSFNDADLKTLEAVGDHLTSLDLAGTQVSDLGVAQMASTKNLKMIRLSETRVTDACIDTLLAMPDLESVNLYGTKVTDGGVLKLSGLSRLKRLYLWKTEVSDGAIQTLQKSLPSCEIIRGVSP